MMYPVADEYFQVPAIARHRDINGNFLVRVLQKTVKTLFQTKFSCGGFEAGLRGFINVELVSQRQRGHSKKPLVHSKTSGAYTQPVASVYEPTLDGAMKGMGVRRVSPHRARLAAWSVPLNKFFDQKLRESRGIVSNNIPFVEQVVQ